MATLKCTGPEGVGQNQGHGKASAGAAAIKPRKWYKITPKLRTPMNRADEIVAQIEAAQRELAGVAASSDEKLNEELRAALEELKTVSHRWKREGEMRRRGSRGFAGYLVAICIGGVAGALAWQSYGEASKQIIATRAPELGWSPEAKQTIAGWIQQLGWTKPSDHESTATSPSVPETTQAAPVAQTASEAVAPKTLTTSSIDVQKVRQIEADIAAVRQTVEQLAAGQDQMVSEITKLQAADMELLAKIPSPPAQPPAAPSRKSTLRPPVSRAQTPFWVRPAH
jgi:hypothetical protein